MNKTETVGALQIILGTLLVSYPQIIFWQRAFDIADSLRHEFFKIIPFTVGITLLITARFNKTRSAEK
jgi:hypothetical protein